MATITNFLLSKPPSSPSLPKQPNPLFFRPTTYSTPSLAKPNRPVAAGPDRPRGFTLRATAATQKSSSSSSPPASDERVQQVHSAEEFDEALRAAKDRLVVVEYAASRSASSSSMYPFMVQLSRQCSDVVFLLVMGDESEATRELCRREKVQKAPHFSFYKSMERVHDEEGIGPDRLVGDVLYYGDSHSAVEQLHSR